MTRLGAPVKDVAEVYLRACEQGRWPTDAVARIFERPRSTAGRWVMEARRAGLIPPTTQGKTPKRVSHCPTCRCSP